MTVATRNNVQVAGPADGRPIVFVHGFGCDQNVWRLVAPAFANAYRTVVLDLVGAGASDLGAFDPHKYATLHGHAGDVAEILDDLDLRDVVVAGHSVGATIAALAAIDRPGRVTDLVLVAPSPRFIDDDGYTGGFSRADIDELLESLDRNWLGWSRHMAPVIMGNPDRPELGAELTNSFCRTDPDIAAHFARVTFLSDHRDDYPRVGCRTLVLQCSDDLIAPAAVGDYVHASIAGSELVRMQATGHCPHLSAPVETVAAIQRFLVR